MQYLREAAQDLQRNLATFLLYAGIVAGAQVFATLVSAPFGRNEGEPASTASLVAGIAVFLVFVHAVALAQTIAFSRLGREIDRPLWKVRTGGEALKRFFMMWALINLTAMGLHRLSQSDFGSGDAVTINYLLLFAGLGATLLSVPVGACIMFTGQVRSRLIGESLSPLSRQPGRTALVIGIMLFEVIAHDLFVSLLIGGGNSSPSLPAQLGVGVASSVVQVYLDCLAFAATWHLCMVDRETVDEIDLDF